jgi:four helix bundle protein
MRNDKDNIIVNKVIEFSLSIIKYCEVLEKDRKYIIARQLFRSGTSIGVMYLNRKTPKAKLISFIK